MKIAPIGGGTRKNCASNLEIGSLPPLTMIAMALAMDTSAGGQMALLRSNDGR